MLKELISFWWETHEPWLSGPFFSGGWLIPFAQLAWPAGVSYGIAFEINRRNRTEYLLFTKIFGTIILFLSLFLWVFTDFQRKKEILYLLTWSMAWLLGLVLYELPRKAWSSKKKRK